MRRKIAKNTLILSVSQIVARVVGFLYFIFLARFLGVENFGVYNFVLSFVYSFIPVADFGIERLVLRDISRQPKRAASYLRRLLPLRFLITFGAYIGALACGAALGRPPRQIFYLAILGLMLFPYNLIYLFTNLQNAREKMGYMAMVNISTPVLTAFLGAFFILLKLPIGFFFLAVVLANLAIALVFLIKASIWDLDVNWVVDRKFWRQTVSRSWVFAGLTIIAVFYLRTTVLAVAFIKGTYYTGIYSAAFKFIEALILIPQSFSLALFPLSSRLFVGNLTHLKELYKRGLRILVLLALPICLLLMYFSRLIIESFYGRNYQEAIPVLLVLGIALFLFFLNSLAGNIIQNSPEAKHFLKWLGLKWLFHLCLCVWLISRFSVIGAAWALVGGEFLGVVVNNLFVLKILRK
ncbi:MAG TPA: flippase [Candidatus Bathyarchaeia archaeon]|nr:flippase [Candidatus Bathyarchaeia archaeon]